MVDSLGRNIQYLRISVTERCNLRCRYCMPADGICKKSHADMLTEEELIRAVEAAASLGITKVRVTGGEPLIKKNILSICRRTAAVEGIAEVCLTTNGILLPEVARPLREAGVRRINLSLDTLKPEKYAQITRIGQLDLALRGLEAALDAGFEKVKVNTVLIGGFNEDEVSDLANLTCQYPLDLRFIELMPMVDSTFGPEAFLSCDHVLKQLPQLQPVGQEGVAVNYRLPDGQGCVGLIRPVSAHFCGACNRLRLTADGKLKPCLHASEEFSIKGADYETMVEQFRRAIYEKPARHGTLSAACHSQAGRNMNQIGG